MSAAAAIFADAGGEWVTIDGRHVLIGADANTLASVAQRWHEDARGYVAKTRERAGELLRTGGKLDPKDDAAAIILGIRGGSTESKPLYRGIATNKLEGIDQLKPGAEFEFLKPQSFSRDEGIAQLYATTGKGSKRYVFETVGPVQGMDVGRLARKKKYSGSEAEMITNGRFKVLDVKAEGGGRIRVRITQKGIH